MVNMDRRYSSGDVVENLSNRGIGILLEKSKNNPEYWKVLCKSGVEVWFASNIQACTDGMDSNESDTVL